MKHLIYDKVITSDDIADTSETASIKQIIGFFMLFF